MISTDLRDRIEHALDSIRDYLQSDGGDVRVHGIDEEGGVVEVELLGNCESCSMSAMTMRAGIEQVIFKIAPEIKKVVSVKG